MTREEKIGIQRNEIAGILEFLKDNQFDLNNDVMVEKLESAITRVFELEIRELGYSFDSKGDSENNTFDLQFVNDEAITWRGEHTNGGKWENGTYTEGKPIIKYNLARLCPNLSSNDANVRLSTCKNLFKTVFHEIQHHRQYMMARSNVSSKEGMMYARDFAVRPYLKKEWYTRDKKRGNYAEYAIENNANEVGYRQYLETMGDHDKEMSDLRDIERGKFSINRYKADIDSWDGKTHYDSGGLQERDDVTIPILDSIISERGLTEMLIMFPILQKEYNLDGSKKTAYELITNMNDEIDTISQNTSLSKKEKDAILKDGKEMYYELIYRQIEKSTPEQLAELSTKIGKDNYKQLLGDISHYFQCELENRLGKAGRMAGALERTGDYDFIMPSNNGTIEVEQNGKKVQMTFDEFIKTIDPQLLEQKFNIPAGKNKGEISASEFIKNYCFENLSQSGIMTLKDGTEITAKEFVENHFLQMGELRADYTPKRFFKDTIQSDTPWAIQKQHVDRLVSYYDGKRAILSDAIKQVEDPTKQEVSTEKKQTVQKPERKTLTPEQQDRKMQFIREIIASYDATEDHNQYAYRKRDEDDNTLQVLRGIENGEFHGTGLSAIDLNYFENAREFNIARSIPKIARLLKVADNITIDGGRNYLEEFANIPNIDEVIEAMMDSNSVKEFFEDAQKNIKSGNLPQHKKTRAELDKKLAQDYLKSGSMSKSTIEEELAYRADTLRGADEVVVDFDAKTTSEIPLERRQKTALTRIIARQQGKVPSQVMQKNGTFVFVVDTQKEQKQTVSSDLQVADSDINRTDYITPAGITDSSIRIDATKQELNGVVHEIRKTQTRDLQQSHEM